MTPNDLQYENLVRNVINRQMFEGRTESASFLAWFLENILRLDDTSATDAICDGPSDRGIDGIFVDHDNSEIIFLQSKVRQNEARTLGDQPIRDFAGSIAQFQNADAVGAAIAENPNSEVARLLSRAEVADRLKEGYTIRGCFVSNSQLDEAGAAAAHALSITVYDRTAIADRYIEISSPDRIDGEATFDVADTGFLEYQAGTKAKLSLIVARATDLVRLTGISDGSLFAKNVRLSLGNTKVNKDIAKTLSDRAKHSKFPMYHNGITIVCASSDHSDGDTLRIRDYVVVNGAQSLSVLYRNREQVTDDLRVVVKIIEIADDEDFAREITISSNNQNSIKPRDLRSTNILQTRLQSEFEQIGFEGYQYIIKRGEEEGANPISNEEAGRMLLAFDVREPWSCHQIYKVFDDRYVDIFGRPAVNAWRIVLLDKIMASIIAAMDQIKNEPIKRYRLTRYFLLFAIAKILDEDPAIGSIMHSPEALLGDPERLARFLEGIGGIAARLCVDLRFEFTEGDSPPDYKAVLKSPKQVATLEEKLRRSYLHDVARGREQLLSTMMV